MACALIALSVAMVVCLLITMPTLYQKVDRASTARAEMRARERRAEAQIQRRVQDAMQQLFDATRRQL